MVLLVDHVGQAQGISTTASSYLRVRPGWGKKAILAKLIVILLIGASKSQASIYHITRKPAVSHTAFQDVNEIRVEITSEMIVCTTPY